MIAVAPMRFEERRPSLGVIGVGGAGGNVVANMIAGGVPGVAFIVANTDAQALNVPGSHRRIQLGVETTAGLGAGSKAEIGKAAAEESLKEIERALDGVQMCFIAAGMGGGTGTGAAPVIARMARSRNILTVGVVTRPFEFEGARRARVADAGIELLAKEVDTLIVVPNQNLFRIVDRQTTVRNAFHFADEILCDGVRAITDLLAAPCLVNLDLADMRFILEGRGRGMMGTGRASGEDRALRAAEQALSHPLLDGGLEGGCGLIVSITAAELLLSEVAAAADHIEALLDPEAHIVWGSAIDPGMAPGEIRISIVATGLCAAAATPASEAPQQARNWRPAVPLPVVVPGPIASGAAAGPEGQAEPAGLPPAEDGLDDLSRGALLFQRMTMVAGAAAGNGPSAANPLASDSPDDPAVYDRRPARDAIGAEAPVRIAASRSR
jgi:cell division protein FtsZ